MRTVRFVNPRDNVLHVETALGIINIRVGLHDAYGNKVESVEIIPNDYAGEPKVAIDGYRNNRLIETEMEITP